jgi:hypothetical protein
MRLRLRGRSVDFSLGEEEVRNALLEFVEVGLSEQAGGGSSWEGMGD